jgi:hypothetical protein
MHHRGLKQFRSVRDGKAPEYVDISSLANEEMPVLSACLSGSRRGLNWSNPKNVKMALISKQNALAGRMTIGGGHSPPISSPF